MVRFAGFEAFAVGAVVWFCLGGGAVAAAEDGPLMGRWRYFPVAHGTPEEPLPPAEELLKVVPPLREAPAFSPEQRELGVALWWGECSRVLFSEQPPTPEGLAREPEIRTPPGEDEPLVLGMWGVAGPRSVTLGVKASPFPVKIRTVEFAPRYLPTPYRGVRIDGGRVVGFATYLPESAYAEIRPQQNAVFWITVSVPEEAEAGRYTITFHVVVHQVREFDLTAVVEVLPFTLPRADIAFGMYFRPIAQVDARYRKPELMQAYWRDMARHGMTSATHYMYTRSGDFIDTTGRAKGNLATHDSVRCLKEMKAEGLIHPEIPVMLLSSNLAKYPEAAGTIRDEMKKRELPELLLYGRDEPPVDDKSREMFEAMQAVRPLMRNVTAISDYAAATYADLIDVWVVHGARMTPEIRRLARVKGAELWTYDCNHRGRGNATRARFFAGLFTWALELKGNFHWCYTEQYAWEGDRNAIFNFVLPSDNGPVPSVAWEARREGVEDYRLLRLLESRIASTPDSPPARASKAWLQQIRGRVSWDLIQGMPKSVYPWDGAEVHPMCPGFEPAELSQLRSQLIDRIVALAPTPGK